MPHWCGVHEHQGKPHHMLAPQCALLQGQPSSPSFHANHAYLWLDVHWSTDLVFLAGMTLGLPRSYLQTTFADRLWSRTIVMSKWVLACAILELWGMLLWLLLRLTGLLYYTDGFASTHCSSSRLNGIVCMADLQWCETPLSWPTLRSPFYSSMSPSGMVWISLCWASNSTAASLPSPISAWWASWHIWSTSASIVSSVLFLTSCSS